jgi:hypothetical protein
MAPATRRRSDEPDRLITGRATQTAAMLRRNLFGANLPKMTGN